MWRTGGSRFALRQSMAMFMCKQIDESVPLDIDPLAGFLCVIQHQACHDTTPEIIYQWLIQPFGENSRSERLFARKCPKLHNSLAKAGKMPCEHFGSQEAKMKQTVFACALMLGTATGVQAATIQNGSFETGTNPTSYITLGTGSTGITGWTVASGTVDYIGSYWVASDGNRSVDMAGNSLGSISTMITDLIVGLTYSLTFDMSGNPDGLPPNKQLTVSLSDPVTTSDYFYDYVAQGTTRTDMQWVTYGLSFVATATSSLLTFATGPGTGGSGCCFGPALDNVSISAVPVPAGGVMLLSALAGFGFLRRRKRA